MHASALLIASATAMVALASPLELVSRTSEAPPTVQVCPQGPSVACIYIPIVDSTCVDFIGGLTFLNKEVSVAAVPAGYLCTFYQDSGCAGGDSDIVLQSGITNFSQVPGPAGTISFNDLASSFSCSPI